MKRIFIFALVLGSLLFSGCWHWKWKRSPKPKEITAIATDVEDNFRQRWMEKRTGELVQQGMRIDIARQQAIDEFQAKYPYIRSNNK
jgi:hypothetical protein